MQPLFGPIHYEISSKFSSQIRFNGTKISRLLQQVNLVINPPTLPFTRSVRFSCDVVIHFIPKCTGEEVIHKEGHIFLLTDLFLVCEKMSRAERGQNSLGRDMWLLYPPLAGKHLRTSPTEGSGNTIIISISPQQLFDIDSC